MGLRDQERGGSTIEYLGIGGIVLALVAAVVLVVPGVGGSFSGGVSTLLCRVTSIVTGQGCGEPQRGDGDQESDEGEQPPAPLASECIPFTNEADDQVVLDGTIPVLRGVLGGRFDGKFTSHMRQRADGRWEASVVYDKDVAGTLNLLGLFGGKSKSDEPSPVETKAEASAGGHGAYGRTWIVDSQEEATRILESQYLKDVREIAAEAYKQSVHIPVVTPFLTERTDSIYQWLLGDDGFDPGPPQIEFEEEGRTAGLATGVKVGGPLGLGAEAGVKGRGRLSNGISIDQANHEREEYVNLTLGVEAAAKLQLPLLGPQVNQALDASVAAAGSQQAEVDINVATISDLVSDQPKYLDVTYQIQGTSQAGASGSLNPFDVIGGRLGKLEVETGKGGRTVVNARLPMDALNEDQRQAVQRWMGAVLDSARNEAEGSEALAALADGGPLAPFDSLPGASITVQQYDTGQETGERKLGLPGAELTYQTQAETQTLDGAAYWAPGQGFVEWEGCGG